MIGAIVCLICALANVPFMLDGNIANIISFVFCLCCAIYCFVLDY